jgi:predicted dehydrogenase
VSVFAYTDRLAHTGIEVEDVLVALLRFESGALATLHATTAAFPGSGIRLQVHGSQGTAVIHDDQLESASFADPADPPAAEPFGAPKPEDTFIVGHLRQYEDIVDAISTGRPPGVGVEDGFLALSVVEAVYESAKSGTPVAIEGIIR